MGRGRPTATHRRRGTQHVVDQIATDKNNGADEDAASNFVSAYRNAVGNAGGVVPKAKAAKVLNACQIPAEKITSETDSRQFAQTVTRTAAVATKMVDLGKATPVSIRPVLTTARTVTSLAYRVTSVGPAAQRPLLAGVYLIALGVLASTSTSSLVSVFGLLAVLAGVLLVAVSAASRITLALAVVTTAAGVALATAAYMPLLRITCSVVRDTAIPNFDDTPPSGRSSSYSCCCHRYGPP